MQSLPSPTLTYNCLPLSGISVAHISRAHPSSSTDTPSPLAYRLAAVFLIICPLPAVHSCCCFCERPPPPDHSPAFTASPASSASSLSNTTDTSVRTQWEVFSSPPPLLQKSPCRVWAPKSFWQDSLSHVIYHTKHLLYFTHQSLLIDMQLVTSAAFFFVFFYPKWNIFKLSAAEMKTPRVELYKPPFVEWKYTALTLQIETFLMDTDL